MRTSRRAGAVGMIVGVGALALLGPSLVNGSARSTLPSGAGADEAIASRPFIARLSGANEVPAADPDGEGVAAVTVDVPNNQVCVDLRATNITTAVAAHIHIGVAGVNGPVVIPLEVPNPTSATCVEPTDLTLVARILADPAGFYVNVHTADYPGGAIRGQLAPSGTTSGATRMLNEPLRAYDSRNAPATILLAGETRPVSLAYGLNSAGLTQVAVPPGATGALLRVTVTNAVGSGFLKVYSAALATPPATSNVNWYADGAIVGADTIVSVDALSRIKVTAGINQTHFVVDVVGYVF